MTFLFKPLMSVVVALATVSASVAHADVRITEVAPLGSGNTSYAADWFELTNTGAADISIVGWKMDDNSNSFATSVALRGVTSISAGQSVIFIEGKATGATDAALNAAFTSAWFGGNVPAGLAIGYYGGAGVGLSAGGDGVNVFNASGVLRAKVTVGVSPTGPVFTTFDNAAGLNNAALTQFSVVGANGAFAALNDANQFGSPGSVTAVPEPETFAMLLAGLGLLGAVARKRQSK